MSEEGTERSGPGAKTEGELSETRFPENESRQKEAPAVKQTPAKDSPAKESPPKVSPEKETPQTESQPNKESSTRQQQTTTQSSTAARPQSDHDHGSELHHFAFPTARSLINWLLTVIFGYICLSFSLTAHHIYGSTLKVGDKTDRDIFATHSVNVVDESATELGKAQARESVMPVFVQSGKNDEKVLTALKTCLNEIEALQRDQVIPLEGLTTDEHLNYLIMSASEFETTARSITETAAAADAAARAERARSSHKRGRSAHSRHHHGKAEAAKHTTESKTATSSVTALIATLNRQRSVIEGFHFHVPNLTQDELLIAVTVTPDQFPDYATLVNQKAGRACKFFHRLPSESNSMWIETVYEFLPDKWSPELRRSTAKLMCAFLEPNIEIDKAATLAKAEELASQVKPVMKKVTIGQLVVPKGGTITKQQLDILTSMGITEVNRWPMVFTLVLSLAAAVFFVGIFLYEFEPKQLLSSSSVALMYTVCVLTVTLSVMLGKTYPQFVPLPAAALILTIFCGQRVAAAVTLPLAVFLAADHLIDFNNLVALGTAAGAGIGFYSPRRHALMSTGIAIAAMQAVGFAVASFISQTQMPAPMIGKMLGFEFLGGMGSAILAIGMLPFLENIFGMITPFRLAELTDADQPLLRKLEENAPGTYQHSLAVANLAEAGARAIAGDVNLVRAGAFYHDVGKMVRPRYFIENQLGDKNPHDSMTPEQSRERVLAHVTDGLALAKEYRLPKAVQDFIPMHQGTSLMAYFYHKACVRDGAENVDSNFYRYPGPKPQSRETSIVMLADVSEAVTHSMKDPSQEEVETAIDKVFQNRWEDGQFTDSGLTYSELQRVKKAFVHVWRTLHHERLKYPSTTTGRMAVPPELSTTSPLSEYSNSSLANGEPSDLC